MKQKLRRSRRSVFGKKKSHPALKAMLWIVVCVAVVAVGFFGAKWITEGPSLKDNSAVGDTPSTPDRPGDNSGTNDDEHPAPDTPSQPTDTPALSEAIRAFYLPHSALSADTLTEGSILREAAAAGFNAVVFDLKDADGTLYYHFNNAQAKKVNAYAPNAFTADQLAELFALVRECGLQPIPRLYAFCDNAAAKVLTDARISLESNHTWTWYDGDPDNGGKRWLNPYAPAAQDYVIALADELKDAGAAAVMLDGVQFPAQLKSAYLGEEAATVTKGDALTAFVARARTELGADCPLLLGCTSVGALGTDTKIYGGNPLTFGSSVASPLLAYNGKIKESVEKMILRTQVLEQKTILAPMLAAEDLSVSQVNDAIGGVVTGGTDSFILYAADGTYDFAAYNLP